VVAIALHAKSTIERMAHAIVISPPPTTPTKKKQKKKKYFLT